MDEILKQLAAHTGVSVETAKSALGAILAFLKEHLPEGVRGEVMKALPQSEELTAFFDKNKSGEAPSSGLLGAVVGMASKVLGGSGADLSKLTGMLRQSGLDLSQVQAFIPKALELLKNHLPPELFEKIAGLIPGMGAEAGKA